MADLSTRVSNLKERAQDTAMAAGETAQEAKGVVQEAAAAVGHKAQEMASSMAHKAQDVASAAAQKTEGALSSVGQSMSSLGGRIREKGPHEGMAGSAATAMAEGLRSGGRYLQEHRLSEMADDVATVIRKHPMSSLCVAFGLGCLIGMVASRR